jgi:hypothetical protein
MPEYRVGFETISPLSIGDLSSAFYGAFDGVLTERDGRITVFAYVEGPTGFAAGFGVVPKLEELGFCIVRVDQDFVDGPEIASRLNVSRQAVQLWAQGNRGSNFPHPVGAPGGKRIWAWGQISEWATREGRFDEPPGLTLDEAAQLDAFLAARRASAAGGQARLEWALSASSSKRSANLAGPADYVERTLRRLGA